MQALESHLRQDHVQKIYYRKVNQRPKGGWRMEISYSSSFPQSILGIKLAARCMETASVADSTTFFVEEIPCNYFMPIIRNGRQIIWKKEKQWMTSLWASETSPRAATLITLPQPALVRKAGKILLEECFRVSKSKWLLVVSETTSQLP